MNKESIIHLHAAQGTLYLIPTCFTVLNWYISLCMKFEWTYLSSTNWSAPFGILRIFYKINPWDLTLQYLLCLRQRLDYIKIGLCWRRPWFKCISFICYWGADNSYSCRLVLYFSQHALYWIVDLTTIFHLTKRVEKLTLNRSRV